MGRTSRSSTENQTSSNLLPGVCPSASKPKKKLVELSNASLTRKLVRYYTEVCATRVTVACVRKKLIQWEEETKEIKRDLKVLSGTLSRVLEALNREQPVTKNREVQARAVTHTQVVSTTLSLAPSVESNLGLPKLAL